MGSRVEEASRNALCLVYEAVPTQAGYAECSVMRPDRAVVIADGVVGGHGRRKGSDSPPGEHLIGHEVRRDASGLVGVGDSCPEEVADVGRERVDLVLVLVECDSEPSLVRKPKPLVEARFE